MFRLGEFCSFYNKITSLIFSIIHNKHNWFLIFVIKNIHKFNNCLGSDVSIVYQRSHFF